MPAFVHVLCVICGQPLPVGLRAIRRTCEGGLCALSYRQHLEAGRSLCSVCGRPLPGDAASDAPRTCDDLACRRAVALFLVSSGEDGPPRCGVCRVLLPPERRGENACGCRECADVQLRREAAASAAERAKRLEVLRCDAELERTRLAEREGVADPGSYHLTIIPSFSRDFGELPADRLDRFVQHLRGVIREVFAVPLDRSPAPPQPDAIEPSAGETGPPQSLFAAACALCRGKCCRHGGEHAYLSAETIRRFRERHPDSQADDVAAAYLQHVPRRTFAESCVFHGERGCALPTEMRPATCNAFFCDSLQELRNELSLGAPARNFFVSAEDLTIIAAGFVDANSTAT